MDQKKRKEKKRKEKKRKGQKGIDLLQSSKDFLHPMKFLKLD